MWLHRLVYITGLIFIIANSCYVIEQKLTASTECGFPSPGENTNVNTYISSRLLPFHHEYDSTCVDDIVSQDACTVVFNTATVNASIWQHQQLSDWTSVQSALFDASPSWNSVVPTHIINERQNVKPTHDHNMVEGGLVSGTFVLTEQGWIIIEELRIGDLVWSAVISECVVSSITACDDQILTWALQPVTQVFTTARSSSDYAQIQTLVDSVTNGNYVASNDHPVYELLCACWMPVSALNSSHKLLSAAYTIVNITALHKLSDSPNDLITCFNIEVAENHNFFISTSRTIESSILVHNPNAIPTYSAQGGHPNNGDVGIYHSLNVRKVAGKETTKAHSPPVSAHPDTFQNARGNIITRDSTKIVRGRLYPVRGGNLVALVHDQDVEAHLQSTTTRPGAAVQQAAAAYRAKLQRLMNPRDPANLANPRVTPGVGMITSYQFCRALSEDIKDFRQALTSSRGQGLNPDEVIAYNQYLRDVVQKHQTEGNIHGKRCKNKLNAQINSLF